MHERRAMDGLRGRDRYRERCLARNVRKNQILGTYVWTPPRTLCIVYYTYSIVLYSCCITN